MKNQLLLFILFLSVTANATDTLTIYYDQDWEKTRKKSEAFFYRKTYKKEKKKWVASDFFINGQLQMEGQFTSKKGKVRTGKFTYYHENGQIESVGFYKDDYKNGEWLSFYEDGKKESEGVYDMWDKQGVWLYYFENGQLEQESLYKDDRLDGESIYYFESGALFGQIMYEMGKDVKVQFWNEKGVEQKDDLAVEVMPAFPGGDNAMANFIKDEFKFPNEAIMKGKSGTVYVEMVVTKYGFIEDVKIVKGVSPSLNAECIRVVRAMPDWKPGKQMNKPVNVRYTIPIKCRIG